MTPCSLIEIYRPSGSKSNTRKEKFRPISSKALINQNIVLSFLPLYSSRTTRVLTSCLTYFYILKMEAIFSSETLVNFDRTEYFFTGDSTWSSNSRENHIRWPDPARIRVSEFVKARSSEHALPGLTAGT
jgi:hypothetical protein